MMLSLHADEIEKKYFVKINGRTINCEKREDAVWLYDAVSALRGLYEHTKNDMTICGLNQAAKEALESEAKG